MKMCIQEYLKFHTVSLSVTVADRQTCCLSDTVIQLYGVSNKRGADKRYKEEGPQPLGFRKWG